MHGPVNVLAEQHARFCREFDLGQIRVCQKTPQHAAPAAAPASAGAPARSGEEKDETGHVTESALSASLLRAVRRRGSSIAGLLPSLSQS